MDDKLIRRVLFVSTLVMALVSVGCVVVPGRGHGRGWGGHPHGGPPGHTGIHPGRGHGR